MTPNRPIPRRLIAARNLKKMAKYASRQDEELETAAGATRIYYTDAACAKDDGEIRAATAWHSPSAGIPEVKLLDGRDVSTTEEAKAVVVLEAIRDADRTAEKDSTPSIFTA